MDYPMRARTAVGALFVIIAGLTNYYCLEHSAPIALPVNDPAQREMCHTEMTNTQQSESLESTVSLEGAISFVADRPIDLSTLIQRNNNRSLSINDLAILMESHTSLLQKDIIYFNVIGGYVPVDVNIGQSVFVIHNVFLPKRSYYITVDGLINDLELYSLLTRRASTETVKSKGEFRIVDVAVINNHS
jgi:hypothetical protein